MGWVPAIVPHSCRPFTAITRTPGSIPESLSGAFGAFALTDAVIGRGGSHSRLLLGTGPAYY